VQKSRPRRSLLTALPALVLVATAGAVTTNATTASALSASPASATASPPAALTALSCTSATFCMAVGNASTAITTKQLGAERWDGAHWHRLPIAKPSGVAFPGLAAVACPSSTECVAVGWGAKGATGTSSIPIILLAETWTAATGWTSSQPVQPPAGSYFTELNAISCPTTSLCLAAGDYTTNAGEVPLVERWTAGTWTRDTLSMPPGAPDSYLNGIACPSAGQCAAVGTHFTASTMEGLIEQLSGATWTDRTAPGSTGGFLNDVSCPTTTACEAIGVGPSGTLAERWAGGSWVPAVPPEPKNVSSAGLYGVSCASATQCVATGQSLSPISPDVAFIDTLNPSWTMTAQTGSGFGIAQLNDVSCWPTATKAPSCALLGDTTASRATQRPLSVFLTGTKWTIIPTV
jgi:hypothetical protein